MNSTNSTTTNNDQTIARLWAENERLRQQNRIIGQTINDLMRQYDRLASKLENARCMACLWKRIAKEHWVINQAVNDYVNNLRLDEETE